MGVSSSSNDHGDQMAWDAWRVYTETTLHQIANRQGELRPKALLYTKQSDPLSGSYQAIYDTVVADLNAFYYSSGNTRSARWGVKVYWSNGNEMSNKGMLATTPHSATRDRLVRHLSARPLRRRARGRERPAPLPRRLRGQ